MLDFAGTVGGGSTQRTLDSFGYEWNAFDGVRAEDENFAEVYFRDLDFEGLKGKVGLDAGCGKGRFTRVLARDLEAEVALDGSSAAEAAARNLGDMTNVTVVQSDLRNAPFEPESFDFISSLGVLHHLDDPFAAFKRLLTYLAPKGQILLYLYSRPAQRGVRSAALSAATALRTVTVRLPHRTLKTLATPIAGVLYAGHGAAWADGDRSAVCRAWPDFPWTPIGTNPSAAWRWTPSTASAPRSSSATYGATCRSGSTRPDWSSMPPEMRPAWFVLAHKP